MSETEQPREHAAREAREWRHAGLDARTIESLRSELPMAQLQSMLIDVMASRAESRRAADVMRQWRDDRFVRPAALGPRELMPVDAVLFDSAASFEAIELSPLTPAGTCSVVAPGSARRIVAAVRGGEVVSDPTNAMALECASRLREDPRREVHLATSHRCVRAQPPPAGTGYAAHFRLFAMASAGHERADRGFVADAVAVHIGVYLRALQVLQQRGYGLVERRLRLRCAAGHAVLADRVMQRLSYEGGLALLSAPPAIEALDHGYYDGGLRLMIDVGPGGGAPSVPLIDGGVFRWMHPLAGSRKFGFVASAAGTQLLASRFAPAG